MSTAKKPAGVHSKLAAIQAEMTAVEKTGSVNFGGIQYQHMQEHGILALLRPALKKHKASVIVDVAEWRQEGNHTFLEMRVRLTDIETGQEIVASYPNGATDKGDKGFSKALTQGTKYALQKLFLIPTEDLVDADVNNPEPSTAKKAAPKLSKTARAQLRIADEKAEKIIGAGSLTKARYEALKATAVVDEKIDEMIAWLDSEASDE